MPVNPDVQLECETLALWAHADSPADNADVMVFLAGQLHEAREELAGKRRRHEDDLALAQRVTDLTELAGVLADAYRRQKRVAVDPHCTNPLTWL